MTKKLVDGKLVDLTAGDLAQQHIDKAQPVPAEMVKQEAARRISGILSDHDQRNALAFSIHAVTTFGADPAGWPAELQAENEVLQEKWASIQSLRARSDEIEGMDPVPRDFREDRYWQAVDKQA